MGKSKRYYRRKYRKVKWCSNITNINLDDSSLAASSGIFSNTATLITNPVQSNVTTSQIFTVKNVEVSFNIESTSNDIAAINQITVYIMFVPQGMNVGTDYNIQHPEYIMAMKYLGTADSGGMNSGVYRNSVRVRSRLARKLNTGDSVILYISGINSKSVDAYYTIYGVIRWWTKAN